MQRVDVSGSPLRESIGSPNRAESLADLRRVDPAEAIMALFQTGLGQRVLAHEDLARILLVVATVVALVFILTAFIGLQHTGIFYDLVPDPAAGLGLPF